MVNEKYAADIRNWFEDLAIGAMATARRVRYGDDNWQETHVYDDGIRDGSPTVMIHNLKRLAECAGFEVQYRDFSVEDYYYPSFSGENFVMFKGVKFTDFADCIPDADQKKRRREVQKWRKCHEGK